MPIGKRDCNRRFTGKRLFFETGVTPRVAKYLILLSLPCRNRKFQNWPQIGPMSALARHIMFRQMPRNLFFVICLWRMKRFQRVTIHWSDPVRNPEVFALRVGRSSRSLAKMVSVARDVLRNRRMHVMTQHRQRPDNQGDECEGRFEHKHLFHLVHSQRFAEARRGSRAACVPRCQPRELAIKQGEPRKNDDRRERPLRRFCAPILCHRVDSRPWQRRPT